MRTRFRSRSRRPLALLALVVLAAAAWIAATGLASANSSGYRGAKLVLKRNDPATVDGTGFRPHKSVRITFVSTRTFVRHPVTNSAGAFTSTFPTVIDRCTGFSVTASQPGRKTVVIRSPARPECAPARTP